MEGEDGDSDRTVRLEDDHCQPEKIPLRRLSKKHGGLIQNVTTEMEEDSDSDKTVRLEDYPEKIPLRRLSEKHGGLVQNVATGPNDYTTSNVYVPSYVPVRDVRVGKQLILSRFLDSNFEKLVIDSSENDNEMNQFTNSTRRDYEIKRELLNQEYDDVQDNVRHTDENIIVIDSSDDEHTVQFEHKPEQKVEAEKYTVTNSLEMGELDLELPANDVPPPITNANKSKIRIKVLNPKAINEQAEAKISSELNNDDKTKRNQNIASSIRSNDGDSAQKLIKDSTIHCMPPKCNNSTVYEPTSSNKNASNGSVIKTVDKNTSNQISESTSKNWAETANAKEDNTRNIKINTTENDVGSSTAARIRLISHEKSKSTKGNIYVESNKLLHTNAGETTRPDKRLSDNDTLPISKRVRIGHEELIKNTLYSVGNNVIVDTNTDLINTNILDLCTNALQQHSRNADIVINKQNEIETSKVQNFKKVVKVNTSFGDNLENPYNKERISKFLTRFCSLMIEDLLKKWKSLSEDAENKKSFSISARLLQDEIQKLDALEKVDVQLNCPVCSRISTFTGIDLYDYYNHDLGKKLNRFKKCHLCYGFQKNYNSMIRAILPIQNSESYGPKSIESNQNVHAHKGQPITQKVGTPLKSNRDAYNNAMINSLSKSKISVLDTSSKRDNNNQNEGSLESINNKNNTHNVENIKRNTPLPESVNKETEAPSFAKMENKNNKSPGIVTETLEGNISTVAIKDKVGNEATSIETLLRHPADIVISASSTSNINNDPEHIAHNVISKASNIPEIDRKLSKTILPEKTDNFDKNLKADSNITKTKIPNNGSKLISTTARVEKSTKKVHELNKTTPNNNDALDCRGDNLTTHKRKNKEVDTTPVKRSSITRTSDVSWPSTLNIKANISKDEGRQTDKVISGSTSVTTQQSSTMAHDVNISITLIDNDISDHRVDSSTKEVKKSSDTVKVRRSKETFDRYVGENPIGKTPDVNLPSTSKDHSSCKLGNIASDTPKVMAGDICLSGESSLPNVAVKLKNDGTNLLKTADRLVGKSTSATKHSSETVHDIIMSKTSNDNDISQHKVDQITTEVKSLSDTAKTTSKRNEMSYRSVSENPVGRLQSVNFLSESKNKDKIGNIKANTSTATSIDRCQSKEPCVPNISKNDSSCQVRTGDKILSKVTSNKCPIKQTDYRVYDVKIPETSSNVDVPDRNVIQEGKTSDTKVKVKQLSKTTTITADSVNSFVPKSKNNDTNLDISGVDAKTNISPVKASNRRVSTDISVFNIPPKILTVGNTSALNIPSQPEEIKNITITSIPELKSKSNHPVIIDQNSSNIPNKNSRAGIFIDDEASTKIYYDNTHQRVDRVVTEANHLALEAENTNHASSSSGTVPIEAAKSRKNTPTAMSSREILEQLLPTDEDDCYKNACEVSKTNKRKITNDEPQTSKCMKKDDVKIKTNDDGGNALRNKSPKNYKDAINHALTVNEHLSCKNNPIESHKETTTKKTFDGSSNTIHDKGHNTSDEKDNFSIMREMLLCENDEVINNPAVHSIAISDSNEVKYIISEIDKLIKDDIDEDSHNVNTNKAKDDQKPYEGSIVKKSNVRLGEENKISHGTSEIEKKLENNESRDRAKKDVGPDSAKEIAEHSVGDTTSESVNVKENIHVLNSGTLFLETSKKIINSKILYECPICTCIFSDSNIYLGHLKSDHNLSNPVLLNNNSNQNDEAESVDLLNNSETKTSTEVNTEGISTPLGRVKYVYKCSICKDTLPTYYSARSHKSEFHPKKKYIKIYERIRIDCETGKEIMDTNNSRDKTNDDDSLSCNDDYQTTDDEDINNENKKALGNEVCDEDTNIESNNNNNEERNEVLSNMSSNNVVIISDNESVDKQSIDVGQQENSGKLSSPSESNNEKNYQSNGKHNSTSDSNANNPNNKVVCKAGVSNENEQGLSDRVSHGHEISFSTQDDLHKTNDKSDANVHNKDSKNGNDLKLEEKKREGTNVDNNEDQSHYRRNIKPNENVMKYGYKCKICKVVCPSKYASFVHRKFKHYQMSNRKLFDRVSLFRSGYNHESEKTRKESAGKSIPIGEGRSQPVSIDNQENKTKEKAQTKAEDNQQKNEQIISNLEYQGKESDINSNKTNGNKLNTNNHNSTEKLSIVPERPSTYNSHNLVKMLSAGISHVNQRCREEYKSSNNEDQETNQIIHTSIVSRNLPKELSSHDPIDDNVQRESKHKEEDKTNDKRRVQDNENDNRETDDEITQNQSDIQTEKLPASQDTYVLTCVECGYSTEVCDSVVRHCQNHYNGIKEPTTYCTICRLNFVTDDFESHQNSHGNHVSFKMALYSYKSLFLGWDKIFCKLPSDVIKDSMMKSIYKTNCIKMVVVDNGPWEDSLYLCGQCITCVPPQEIEQHFRERCYFVSYPCYKCKRCFTSLEMLVEHERNHSNSYRLVVFNQTKDKNFNCKLLEARRNLRDLINKKLLATVYKCVCGLAFATLNSFKFHFNGCNFTAKAGILCKNCTFPLHFQPKELKIHEELHHGVLKCKLWACRVSIVEEKVPNDGNTKDMTVAQPKGDLNDHDTAEMDIKKDLLKHDTTDSHDD